MSTTRQQNMSSTKERIKLTLILQAHKSSYETYEPLDTNDEDKESIIFSQFKILQAVSSYYRDAIILAEGNRELVDAGKGRNTQRVESFKFIFRNPNNLQDLDFNKLTNNQKIVLLNNQALTILWYLELINKIYPSQAGLLEEYQVNSQQKKYLLELNKQLMHFPNLRIKNAKDNLDLLDKCISVKDQKDYETFIDRVHANVPEIYSNREKEALDFVVKASKETNNKQVVLVFGWEHLRGFINLINSEYQDRIELANVIDSTIGLLAPKNNLRYDQLHKQAVYDYKLKKYADALFNFKQVADFWRATSLSTPDRNKKIASVEFNLGSCFLQLANTKQEMIDDAIQHLREACDLAKNISGTENKKYTALYQSALVKKAKFNRKDTAHLTPADIPFTFFKPIDIANLTPATLVEYTLPRKIN